MSVVLVHAKSFLAAGGSSCQLLPLPFTTEHTARSYDERHVIFCIWGDIEHPYTPQQPIVLLLTHFVAAWPCQTCLLVGIRIQHF